MYVNFLFQIVLTDLLILAFALQLPGQEIALPQSVEEKLQTLKEEVARHHPTVAVRLSTRFLNELISEPFVVESPVNTTFQGASVRGTAVLQGQSGLCFESLRKNQPLTVLLKGQIRTTTSAAKGPAVVYNQATTHILGQLQLDFDGKSFSTTPISVETCTTSRLDGVCSTGKLASRMVRRIARRRAEKLRPASNRIASQRAKKQIETEGNQKIEQGLARLNKTSRFEETLKSVFSEGPEPSVRVTTTESFVQTIATTSSEPEVFPPGRTMLGNSAIEIWLQVDSDESIAKEIEAMWKASGSRIEELLAEQGTVITDFESFVSQRRVGPWIVVEIAAFPIHTCVLEQG